MLPIPGIVDVNGADLNVRMEGVLDEKEYRNLHSESLENDSSSIREEGTPLPPAESNDVPFPRDVVFDGALNTRCRWCWRVQ